MTKTLYIIRGIPGSGKSTRAREIIEYQGEFVRSAHYEADMFFDFIPFSTSRLSEAHNWCQLQVANAMESEVEVIVVSNTFIKKWEFAIYQFLARTFQYRVVIETMKGNYKSIHNVPQEIIERMKKEFEA